MKKFLFLWTVFAIMMVLAGCTQKEIVYVEKENGTELLPGEGVLTISLSGATTRAARPIDHFDPTTALTTGGNNVNRIGFRIYHGEGDALQLDNNVKITSYSSVNENLPEEDKIPDGVVLNSYVLDLTQNTFSNGGQIQIKLSGLTVGVYNIVAYGYNSDSDEFPYTLENQQKRNSDEEWINIVGLKCPIDYGDDGKLFLEEVFAGAIEANVNDSKLFTQVNELILERQVAGMLVYLKNVPAYVLNEKVGSITISTIIKVNELYFPYMGSDYLPDNNSTGEYKQTDLLTFTFNGDNTTNFQYAANGSSYFFNRSSNGQTEVETKSFLLPDEMDEDVKQYLDDNIECESNTLFGSCFVLPLPGTNTYKDFDGVVWNALNIVYRDVNGDIIKVAPLRDSDSSNTEGYTLKRNHFYTIGTKKTIDVPDSEDEDPLDPDDDPLDISEVTGYDYFILKINDAWGEHYGLVKD